MTVWPGGWVELRGFDDPVEVPLVNLAPPRKKVHRLEACATESRAGKKPPPAWLEGYLRKAGEVIR
jgi:hypothetical protein